MSRHAVSNSPKHQLSAPHPSIEKSTKRALVFSKYLFFTKGRPNRPVLPYSVFPTTFFLICLGVFFSFPNFENTRMQFRSPINYASCHAKKVVETEKTACDSCRLYFATKSPGHEVTLTSFPANLWHVQVFLFAHENWWSERYRKFRVDSFLSLVDMKPKSLSPPPPEWGAGL